VLVVGLAASPAWAVPPDAPPQPTLANGNGQLTVNFSPPGNDGGNPITSYTASCSDGFNPAVTASGPSSPIVVSPLTNGTAYICTVAATNIDGTGSASVPSAPPIIVGAPDAPAAPTVTRGNDQLFVAFTPPADNGSAITGFTAGCISTDGGGTVIQGGASSPITANFAPTANGHNYKCRVTATNANGTGPASLDSSPTIVVASVPDAPAAPTIVGHNGQIAVSISAPANNGDAISSYNAACTSIDGGANNSSSGPSSPVTVTGLTNGKTYACAAAAINGIGAGPASGSSSAIVLGKPDAPLAPTVTRGDAQITVTFLPPADNGNAISSYTAACLSSDGGGTGIQAGPGTPIIVPLPGTPNGHTYRCRVSATNVVGIGPVSPDSAPVIPAGEPNDPPQPTAVPGNHTIQLTWTELPGDSNGSPITSYLASCTSIDGGAPGTNTGAGSPLTVSGLTNGNTYTCDIKSTNAIGQSAASIESDEVVPTAVPDAPAKPTVVKGNARITVSFNAVADNGSPINSYTATCTSTNGGVARSKVADFEPFSPIVVTQLTNGRTYTCRVKATSDLGTSPSSPVSNAVIPRTPPGPPTIMSVVPGLAPGSAGPLTVNLAPGAANGSPITSYRVTCTKLSSGLPVVKTSATPVVTLNSLAAGATYSCVAVDISLGGTSASSAAVKGIVGTPGPPTVVKVLKQGSGLVITFAAAAANGKPISNYQAKCTSSNGGIARGKLSPGSPIGVKSMTPGRTYVCLLNGINARGAGSPTKIGPIVIG
jgi:titin